MGKKTSNKNLRDNDNQKLPLQDFFGVLKANGFTVTPGQIEDTNKIIIQFAIGRENESEKELCNYLSPLFSTNKQEQRQFHELFESYFAQTSPPPQPPPPPHWKKWIIAASVIAILFFLGLYITYPPPLPQTTITLLDSAAEEKKNVGQEPFQVTTTDPLQIKFQTDNGNDIVLKSIVDWGDGTQSDTLHSHQYVHEGFYIFKASVKIYNRDSQISDTTFTQTIKVCNQSNKLTLRSDDSSDTWYATVIGDKPQSIQWSVDDSLYAQGEKFTSPITKAGLYQLTCVAIYDSLLSPCTLKWGFNFKVDDPNSYHATIVPADNAIKLVAKYKVKEYWYWIVGYLILLSASIIFQLFDAFVKMQKKQINEKTVGEKYYSRFIESISSGGPPFILPFKNKDYLTYPESEVNAISHLMQKRIDSEATYLHLGRTIQKSILSSGLFQPVYAPRSLQSEYLVLIDRNYQNGQQFSLFQFLLSHFQNRNVLIEKYYYQSGLAICNRGKAGTDISLESLSDKYPNHILVIIGDGQQLLNPYYPIFDKTYSHLLRRWERRALLTPVPVTDWGQREFKTLQPHIPVYPIDAAGLLLFMRTHFEGNIDLPEELKQIKNVSYSVEKIDFEEIDDLQTFCTAAQWANCERKSNLLFQWIAALALYPKIRWELIIAIGKSILDKHHKSEELNFTNLLRIARISWINQGQFPDLIRLELLKALEAENEVVAREALLICLKESSEIDQTSFAFEEKEIQRVTNEFILYAYDAEKYGAYKDSEQIFKELYRNRQVQDTSAKLYLENKGGWKTLVQGNLKNTTDSIPLATYVENKTKLWKPNFYLSVALFVLSLIAMTTLFILQASNRNVPLFTALTPNQLDEVGFNLVQDSLIDSYLIPTIRIDSSKYYLQIDSITTFPLPFDNKQKNISLEVDSNTVLDTSINIEYNQYTVSIYKEIPPASADVVMYLMQSCTPDFYSYENILHQVNSSFVVKRVLAEGELSKTNCINRIAFGKKVNEGIIGSIVKEFMTIKVALMTSTNPPFPVPDEQIIIYSELPKQKFDVYIQYQQGVGLSIVNSLRLCINLGNFNAPGAERINSITRNEIRYYNESFKDSLGELQNCLAGAFPGEEFTPVLMRLRHDKNAKAEIWITNSTIKENPRTQAQVSIYIDNDSLLNKANQLSRYLASMNFGVTQPIRRSNQGGINEIRYFSPAMAEQANQIKAEYDRIFDTSPPKLVLQEQYSDQRDRSNDVEVFIVSLGRTSLISSTSRPPTIINGLSDFLDQQKKLELQREAINTKWILWVDDNPDNTINERKAFDNCTIVLARSNEEAKKMLVKSSFDLVITDINRDDKSGNGINLLRDLKSQYPQTPVIIYSASAMNPVFQKQAIQYRADYVGNKRNEKEMITKVKEILTITKKADN